MKTLSEARGTQAAAWRAGRSDAKPGRGALYAQALAEAQRLFRGDGVAAHRYAVRAADVEQQS